QIGRLDLSARVCLTGEISSASLVSHYQRATLFALATRYEGYGLVFDEALLHGLPILSCEVGAVPQTVPKAASHLVAPDDPQAFAAALRTLLTRPEKRSQLSKAAFEAGRALPDWTGTAQKVSAIISRLQQSRAVD
ncbi:MAG: glycosyltransferase family 4 protein, partial [Pseudomonadota bacterium]